MVNFLERLPVLNIVFIPDTSYGGMAQFPSPSGKFELVSANNIMIIKNHRWDASTFATDLDHMERYYKFYTAEVIAHELGHALGLLHTHQNFDADKKDKLLPFINTKKSWYSNADTLIPPLTNEDRYGNIQDYKHLTSDEIT